MDFPRLVYFLALAAAAIQCFRSGCHRRAPFFFCGSVAAAAFELAYDPFDKAWMRNWYPLLVGPLLLARAASVIEAFWLDARRFPFRWPIAFATGSLATVFALLIAWRFNARNLMDGAIQSRRVAVVWLAAFLGIYILLVLIVKRWRLSFTSANLVLQSLLCLSMAISAVLRMAYPNGIWHAVNPIAYGVSAFIYLGWLVLFARPRTAET